MESKSPHSQPVDTSASPFISATITADTLDSLAESVRVAGPQQDTFVVRTPISDVAIGQVSAYDDTDVEAAVSRARDAQPAWENRDPADRGAIIERFADLVTEHDDRLLDIVQLETGKARRHAAEELLDVAPTSTYYARQAPDLLADERRDGVVPLVTDARVTREPVGVVGVISPWNYPLTLSITDVIPALLAGNAVVLKPDEKTPYVALELVRLLTEAGLPEDVCTVVTGEGAVVGPALIDRVDYLAFTGGTDTGRVVAEQAGRNLIDSSLELGGDNPMIVLEDADIDQASRGAVTAAPGRGCLRRTDRRFDHGRPVCGRGPTPRC